MYVKVFIPKIFPYFIPWHADAMPCIKGNKAKNALLNFHFCCILLSIEVREVTNQL